jgi:hypothetical protein
MRERSWSGHVERVSVSCNRALFTLDLRKKPTMRSLIQFPVWQFLNQPLFEAHYRPILNPQHFWRVYQIDFLERCFEKEFQQGRLDFQ